LAFLCFQSWCYQRFKIVQRRNSSALRRSLALQF
jgi:hypothetical protein